MEFQQNRSEDECELLEILSSNEEELLQVENVIGVGVGWRSGSDRLQIVVQTDSSSPRVIRAIRNAVPDSYEDFETRVEYVRTPSHAGLGTGQSCDLDSGEVVANNFAGILKVLCDRANRCFEFLRFTKSVILGRPYSASLSVSALH